MARCVADLAAGEARRGWRVAVACSPDGWLAGEVDASAPELLPWVAGREPGPATVGETRRLAALVAGWSPDLVHLHSSKAGLAGRLAVRGRSHTLFQPHGWSFAAVDGAGAALALRWERFATRWVDAVICVSEDERRAGEEAGIRATSRVVPNAVDVDRFRPAGGDERRRARRRVGLELDPPDAPVAVCVSRMVPEKGQAVLLRAWPSVRRLVPDATLVLVGDGPERDRLEAERPDGAIFLGHRGDVEAVMAAADVVVFPSCSRAEGMPLTVLEALASARSVVATDVFGTRETVCPDAGAVVAAGDGRALADALAERLLDPERAAAEGRAGRARAEQAHRIDLWVDRMCRLSEEVLAAGAKPPGAEPAYRRSSPT